MDCDTVYKRFNNNIDYIRDYRIHIVGAKVIYPQNSSLLKLVEDMGCLDKFIIFY